MSFNRPYIFESNTSSSTSPPPRPDNHQGMRGMTQPSADGTVPTTTKAANPSQIILSLPPSQPLLTVGLLPQEVMAVMQARSAAGMRPWPNDGTTSSAPTVAMMEGPTCTTAAKEPSPPKTTNLPTAVGTAASVSPAVMNDLVEILSSAASARAEPMRALTGTSVTAPSPGAVASLPSAMKNSSSSASYVTPSPPISPDQQGLVNPGADPASSSAASLSRTVTSSPDTIVNPTSGTLSATNQQQNLTENKVATVASTRHTTPATTKARISTTLTRSERSPTDQIEAGLIDTLQCTVMKNMQRGPAAPIFIHPIRSPIPLCPRQQQQDLFNTSLPPSTIAASAPSTNNPPSQKRLAQEDDTSPYATNMCVRTLKEHRAVTARSLKTGAMTTTPVTMTSSAWPDSTSSFSSHTKHASCLKNKATGHYLYTGPSLLSCYNKFHDIIPHHPSPVLIPFLCLKGAECLPSTKSLPPIGIVKDDSIKQEHPIQTPGRVDILCGRGRGCTHHLGNCTFRRLIDLYRPVFAALSPGDRPQLVRNLVQYIRWQGGRFLTRHHDGKNSPNENDDPWYECGDEKARNKVSQALRDSKNRWKNATNKSAF